MSCLLVLYVILLLFENIITSKKSVRTRKWRVKTLSRARIIWLPSYFILFFFSFIYFQGLTAAAATPWRAQKTFGAASSSRKSYRERERSFLAHNVLFMATYSAAASAAVRTITQRCAVCVLKMRPLAQTPDAAVYSVVIAYPSSMLLSIFLNSYPHIMLLTSFNCSAAPILWEEEEPGWWYQLNNVCAQSS